MDWRTTYPTLATVMVAGFETLATWDEKLPPPRTDVERTVRRRLSVRLHELAGQQLRERVPGWTEQFNDVVDRMERMGIKTGPRKL